MTEKTFEQEILHSLKTQALRYPAMEPEDVVKFIFQALLGVGHLLSTADAVRDYISREMDGLQPSSDEPLYETLSPAWCRLNLRRAKAEHIQPQTIADWMMASPPVSFTRQDVFDLCRKISGAGETQHFTADILAPILDETWLPSHSQRYREAYHPAYRVISTDQIKAALDSLPGECLSRVSLKHKRNDCDFPLLL